MLIWETDGLFLKELVSQNGLHRRLMHEDKILTSKLFGHHHMHASILLQQNPYIYVNHIYFKLTK